MKQIQVYSTSNCPNCRVLKQLLDKRNINYREVDMATPAALTELHMNGVFTMAAPVLQVDNAFYTYRELFSSGGLDQVKLESLLNA